MGFFFLPKFVINLLTVNVFCHYFYFNAMKKPVTSKLTSLISHLRDDVKMDKPVKLAKVKCHIIECFEQPGLHIM